MKPNSTAISSRQLRSKVEHAELEQYGLVLKGEYRTKSEI
jgi:hypothetical protein